MAASASKCKYVCITSMCSYIYVYIQGHLETQRNGVAEGKKFRRFVLQLWLILTLSCLNTFSVSDETIRRRLSFEFHFSLFQLFFLLIIPLFDRSSDKNSVFLHATAGIFFSTYRRRSGGALLSRWNKRSGTMVMLLTWHLSLS